MKKTITVLSLAIAATALSMSSLAADKPIKWRLAET